MQRNEVKEQYKWKTEDLFASDKDWEQNFDKTVAAIGLAQYSGKLGDRKQLLELFRKNDELLIAMERLAIYAGLKHDEDSSISKYTAYDAKIGIMFAKYSADVAFIEPELAQADDKYLQSLIDDKDFFAYDYQIKRIMQGKPHMLSEEKERLIGMLGETFSTFNETYSMITTLIFLSPR